ncbi:MAG: DUF2796 domain-containing protein [Alphaproteobacteria bacterium]
MPIRRLAIAPYLCAACLYTASAQAADKRHADAHEHGHGSLDIAIEGNTVEMVLEVPGADIVGFEHAAESDADKAALAEAIAKLEKPLTLFVPPAAAGCKVAAAEVEYELDHGEEHDDDHKDGDEDHAKHDEKEHDEEGHAEFHAEYRLTCGNIGALEGLDFAYFAQFPAAEELEVQIITDKGQNGAEVTRESPRLDLEGMN